MILEFEKQLPNLTITETVSKISTELVFEVNDNATNIDLVGQIVVIREIKNQERVTEVKDSIPIEVTVSKRKLINEENATYLHLKKFQLDFTEEYTMFSGEIELTNVLD